MSVENDYDNDGTLDQISFDLIVKGYENSTIVYWIELYNNTDSDISLDGYYLSDDADDLTQWEIPASTIISANGYLIVWVDKDAL